MRVSAGPNGCGVKGMQVIGRNPMIGPQQCGAETLERSSSGQCHRRLTKRWIPRNFLFTTRSWLGVTMISIGSAYMNPDSSPASVVTAETWLTLASVCDVTGANPPAAEGRVGDGCGVDSCDNRGCRPSPAGGVRRSCRSVSVSRVGIGVASGCGSVGNQSGYHSGTGRDSDIPACIERCKPT